MKNNQWKKITTTTSTFDAFIHWINWRVRSLNYAMDFVFLVDMLLLTRILYLMVVQLLIPVLLVPVSSHQLVLVIGEISVRQHQQVQMINFSNKQIIHFYLVDLVLVVCFFLISIQIFFLSLILDLDSGSTSTNGPFFSVLVVRFQ